MKDRGKKKKNWKEKLIKKNEVSIYIPSIDGTLITNEEILSAEAGLDRDEIKYALERLENLGFIKKK